MMSSTAINRRVDQKLLCAESVLAAAGGDAAARTALVEAATFHLHVAYRAYLRELLDQVLMNTGADTAVQAAAVLLAQHLCSADIDELAKMERSGEWPAQLLAAYAAVAGTEMASATVANTGTVGNSAVNTGIVLRDITAQVDADLCAGWLRQFRSLVLRQREHAREW